VITILLWIMIWTGELVTYPVFTAWAVFLTFGNLLYVASFQRAYTRFNGVMRRSMATGYTARHGPALLAEAQARLEAGDLSGVAAASLGRIAAHLRRGVGPGGFIRRHLAGRSLDERGDAAAAPGGISVARLLADTPSWLAREDLPELAAGFTGLAEASSPADGRGADGGLIVRLRELEAMLALGRAEPARQWLRERWRIWVWTFPYLFYQLLPYWKGLSRWLRGKRTSHWHKTSRTPKVVHRSSLSDPNSLRRQPNETDPP
jgi:hypothetical protein